jgi:hypothetical protein
MKRLRRIIFNSLTLLSLLLCVGTAWLWVRSYQKPECFMRIFESRYLKGDGVGDDSVYAFRSWGFASTRGQLGWISDDNLIEGRTIKVFMESLQSHPVNSLGWHINAPGEYPMLGLRPQANNGFGFHFQRERSEQDYFNGTSVTHQSRRPQGTYATNDAACALVPHWFLVVITGASPILWLSAARNRRRRLRELAGLCRMCGYDLRATPERCPECGEVPATGNA